MAFQSTMTVLPVSAVEGMLADSGFNDKVSRFAQGTMSPGKLVVWHAGDADNLARLPTATGEVTGGNALGVIIYDAVAANNPYLANDTITVLKKGRIWVVAEEAVTPASVVFVRFAAGSFPNLGAFRASADTATAVALPGAKFLTSQATIGGLVQVGLDLP